MSSKAKKLGTLADIFQQEKLDGTILKLPIHKIKPSELQPRKNRKYAIEELAKSIQKEGLLSPIIVYKEGDYYRIIAGERRYHAITSLGWKEVECKIISREQKDYFRIALIENLQREDLSADEEAEAMLYLKNQENLTDQELADLIGKSRNYVSEILSISKLPKELKEQLKKLGLNHKNFLIQAVQAYKKGNIENFIQGIQLGEIKTVKDAKEFNKKTTVKEHERSINSNQENIKNTEEINQEIHIQREKNIIKITTSDMKIARKIEKWLNKNINLILD
ncbi:MAG: chromosome partitioning protein ParB [Leptospiraceae bacterium]|nr:MAG: chromosome partitioning protein ParB [Leptospiraceae bacterium]